MKVKITFTQIIQDNQEIGSRNDFMISRIFFDLEIGGRKYPGLHVDVKQTPGADFETAPLEVSAPHGYDGPFDFHSFRPEVEEYYRESFGSRGSAIRMAGGSNIRMINNTVVRKKVVEIEGR